MSFWQLWNLRHNDDDDNDDIIIDDDWSADNDQSVFDQDLGTPPSQQLRLF